VPRTWRDKASEGSGRIFARGAEIYWRSLNAFVRAVFDLGKPPKIATVVFLKQNFCVSTISRNSPEAVDW